MRILLLPIFLSLTLGLGMQLADLANDVSSKTVEFSFNANQAVDCAFSGVPIAECSPDLVNTNFDNEVKRLNDITKQATLSFDNNTDNMVINLKLENKTVAFVIKEVNGSYIIESNAPISQDSGNLIVGNFIKVNAIKNIILHNNDNLFIDINNDKIYDVKLSTSSESLTLSLAKKPTLAFFLSSFFVLLSVVLLAVYVLVKVNNKPLKPQ